MKKIKTNKKFLFVFSREKAKKEFTYISLIVFYLLYRWVFTIANKTQVKGKEYLPTRQEEILFAEDHQSFIDSVPYRANIVSNVPYGILHQQYLMPFDLPDYNNFYSSKWGARLMNLWKNIPVYRNTSDRAVENELVENICNILKTDRVSIFVGGGRDLPGKGVRPCIGSVGRIILKKLRENSDLIVIPARIFGMHELYPRKFGQKYWKIFFQFGYKINIVFGKPIDFSDIIQSDDNEEKVLWSIRRRVTASIVALKP